MVIGIICVACHRGIYHTSKNKFASLRNNPAVGSVSRRGLCFVAETLMSGKHNLYSQRPSKVYKNNLDFIWNTVYNKAQELRNILCAGCVVGVDTGVFILRGGAWKIILLHK